MINLCLIKSNIEGRRMGMLGVFTQTGMILHQQAEVTIAMYFSTFSSVTPSLFTIYKYITRTDDRGRSAEVQHHELSVV